MRPDVMFHAITSSTSLQTRLNVKMVNFKCRIFFVEYQVAFDTNGNMTEVSFLLSSSSVVKRTEIRIQTIASLLSELGGNSITHSQKAFWLILVFRRPWFICGLFTPKHLELHQEYNFK